MGAISLRLPDELEGKLAQEASLSGQPRSQLIREALEALLALAADADACREAQLVAEEFLAVENEALEGHWWR